MRIVRSPHARATFTFGDLASARAKLGLDAILTAADIPGSNSFGIFPNTKDQPVLADGHVRYRGEAVIALVGARNALARINDADLPISFTPLPPVSGVAQGLAPSAPPIHAHIPDNVLTRGNLRCGDVKTAHATRCCNRCNAR